MGSVNYYPFFIRYSFQLIKQFVCLLFRLDGVQFGFQINLFLILKGSNLYINHLPQKVRNRIKLKEPSPQPSPSHLSSS